MEEKTRLVHIGCGGEVDEDTSRLYHFEYEDGTVAELPGIVCKKCGEEILGDGELEWVGPDAEWLNEEEGLP